MNKITPRFYKLKTNTTFRRLLYFFALLLMTTQVSAQTVLLNVGWEGSEAVWGGSNTSGRAVSTIDYRTGAKSLTGTGSNGNGRRFTSGGFNTTLNLYYHAIIWTKSSIMATADIGWSGGSSTYNTNITANTWTRLSSTFQAASTGTGKTVNPTYTIGGNATFYIDDVIVYESTSSTIDLAGPSKAIGAAGATTGLSWTNGSDTGTGATGVRATLIFKRTGGLVGANDLSLNSQGVYSLTATAGPKVVGNWTLQKEDVLSTATSYLGAFTLGDEYAIVHRDLAYNYSLPTYVTVVGPTITGGTTSLMPFTTNYGTASTPQTFTIGGTYLNADIMATATGTGYEVSSDGLTYGDTATFTPSSGTVTNGQLRIRLAATTAIGSYNNTNIVLSSGSATPVNITTSASGNAVIGVSPVLTATTATVDAPFDVIFPDDASWRSAITGITVNGATLAAASYVVSAGKITFTPSASSLLQTSGTKTIVVIATGYNNNTVSQVIDAGVPTTNSTATISPILVSGGTSTITMTAKDQYNNLVQGYSFKYDATITDSDVATIESFTIGGSGTTTTITDGLTAVTDASGVLTFTVELPATIDQNDGISIQVQLNDGTTNVGAVFSYIQLTPQTISFTLASPVAFGSGNITLNGTATSGLTVSYVSSDPTVALVSGNVVTILKVGTTTITASQAGDGVTYSPATPVDQPLVINCGSTNFNTTTISACDTYTWTNNGQTYTGSGTYTGTTTNCTTEQLVLTITPSSINTTTVSACTTYTWANNGQTYNTSGIKTGTTTNCLTEKLDLTIVPLTNYYADTDGDGYGSGTAVPKCTGIDSTVGYVTNNTDCDAADAAKWQLGNFYQDLDGDGYTDTTTASASVCYGATVSTGYYAAASTVSKTWVFTNATNWPSGGTTVEKVSDQLGLYPFDNGTPAYAKTGGSTNNYPVNGYIALVPFTSATNFQLAGSSSPVGNMPTEAYSYFDVAGSCKVTIWFKALATGSYLKVSDGTTLFGTGTGAAANALVSFKAVYVGGPTRLYIYGNDASFIHKIEVTGSAVNNITLAPALTADTTLNTVDNNLDITFTDNAAWRAAVTVVKVGATVLTAGTDYDLTSGHLILKPSGGNSVLTTPGSKVVKIIATGYSEEGVTQTILVGAVNAVNSTVAISPALALNTTSTITCTARDQYNNPVSGYIFKFDAAITNNASTGESYTINGSAYTSNANNVSIATATAASGVATFSATLPAIIDGNDGISIQVQLNDGTTKVGSAFTFTKAFIPQTITFGALSPVVYAPSWTFNLTGSSDSGLAVSYVSSDPTVVSIVGNTVTILKAGTTIITASQIGNNFYSPASDVSQTLIVDKANQTIAFGPLADKIWDDASFTLTATATSGLAVTFASSDTAVATVDATGLVTIVGSGTTTITASQGGNGNYNAAPDELQTLNILDSTAWTGDAATGSWTHGAPDATRITVILGTYNTTAGDITAKNLTVISGGSLTISGGTTVTVQNEVVNNAGANGIVVEDTGSLVQINDLAVNSGNIDYKRSTTAISNLDYTYWSSPVVGFTLGGVSPSTKGDKLFSFDSSIEDWNQESPATVMTPGVGYIIRGPELAPYLTTATPYLATFTGIPNNGHYQIAGVLANKSYLLGNPYPSALDADAFLLANQNVLDGTLYFWTHNTPIGTSVTNPGSGVSAYSGDDYASYNGVGGTATLPATSTGVNTNIPSGKIASGQGFFASSIVAPTATVIDYYNNMRVDGASGNNAQFFKTKNPKAKAANTIEKHRIWLDLTNDQGLFKQTLVGYVTDATNDYDNRFDGVSFDGNPFADFYSINQNKKLVIQGRALPFDENDEVELGFKTTVNGSLTISIDQTDGLLAGQDVFLEDKLTNTVTDLKSGNYTFNTMPGTFNKRFVLRYTNNAKFLGVNEAALNGNSIEIYKNNGVINVNAGNEVIATVKVYDVLGKLIAELKDVNATTATIKEVKDTKQVLVVKVTSQEGVVTTKKVIN